MKLFSEADQEAIRTAVQKAEGETSGEIVPFVVGRSDNYDVAVWRAAALGATLGLVLPFAIRPLLGGWDNAWLYGPAAEVLAGLLGGVLAGFLTRQSPPLLRLFAGGSSIARIVRRRALEAFVEEEVFNTRERTGILLFVSLLERRIEVVGDAGINARVGPEDWAEVVHLIRSGIRDGHPAQGMVSAIGKCGGMLREKGVEIRPDDANELSDRLRFEED